MAQKQWNKIDHLFFTACDESMSARGFEAIGARRWVRGRVEGIRDLLWISKERGGMYSAQWGFALDFVPTIRGDRVSDKTGKASPEADIIFDPYDCDVNAFRNDDWTLLSVLPSSGPQEFDVEAWRDRVLVAAETHFRSVRCVLDLMPHFERKQRTTVRYGFDTSCGLHLAYVFALAKLGRRTEAMVEYLDWASSNREGEFVIEKVRNRLEALFARAGSKERM